MGAGSGPARREREASLRFECGGCVVAACARGDGKGRGYRAGIPHGGGFGCVIEFA